MGGRWRHVVRSLWFLWLIAPGLAQQTRLSPEPPHALEEAVASARRIPGLVANASTFPANVTVITAEDLRRSGARTIQEAISHTAGVAFSDQQGFGLGSDGTVNLRGIINSSRTNALVLVDGIRQNRITGDEVHWQSIPVDQVERIEILRGGGGLLYGEGALAGVINIIIKHDSEKLLETEESAEAGSFGWQKYTVSARGRSLPFGYGVNYTRRLVEGYRESSQSRNTTVTAHGGVEFAPQVHAQVNFLHSEDTTGFPGLLTPAQAEQRRQQTNAFHGFNDNENDQVSLDLITGPWNGLSGVATVFWKRWVQTSEDSINFNPFTVTPSRGLSLRTNHEWTGGAFANLMVNGLELSEDKATTGDPGAGADSESNRSGYGVYVEDTLTFADRVSFVGGLRFDKSRYEESLVFPAFEGTLRFEGWSPKMGVRLTAVPELLDVFAAYARPFKAPSVDDFSSRLGSSFSGNADLEPQQADTYEIGAQLSREGLEAAATAFYTRIDDEILFNQLTSTNQNFDTRRFGVELSSHLQPTEHVRTSATYMYVNAKFTEGQFPDSVIPGTPTHTANLSMGVSPLPGLWLDLHWSVVNDFYRINDFNNQLGKADNYGVMNLVCQYDVLRPKHKGSRWPGITAFFRINNLTDEEYSAFQTSDGGVSTDPTPGSSQDDSTEAPTPPINFIGGITVKF